MPLFNTQVPAIRGKFGEKLLCYQTTIRASDFVAVLGHDPRGKNWKNIAVQEPETAALYEHLQRKTVKDRKDNLKEYIRFRMCPNPLILGAFPAVSVGITEPAQFKPYAEQQQQMSSIDLDVGILLLPNCPRMLLDGLGRVTAALDLLSEEETKGMGIGSWFTFPVTFYVPTEKQGALTKDELGQLFHDFNYRQVRVQEADAIALDQSDLHIRMTSRLGESEVIKRYGGIAETASLGKKSTELVTQKHLLKFVRGAVEGRDAQDSDKKRVENPRLLNTTFEMYLDKLGSYLTRIEQTMTPARFKDQSSIHLTSGGWQVLGLIFNDIEFSLKLEEPERSHVIDRLARIDWSKSNQFWIGLLGEGETDPQTGQLRLGKTTKWGRTVKQQLLDYVRQQCGIREQIAALESAQLADNAATEEGSEAEPMLVGA